MVPLNLLLFLGMLVMLVMIMQLSSETGRLRERTRILAEEVALLRAAIHRVEESERLREARKHSDPSTVESVRVP